MREGSGVRPRPVVAVIAAPVGLTWSPPAGAATGDCFLRVDGVTGDSVDVRHRDEIELVGWSLAMASAAGSASAGGAAATGRTEFQPLRAAQRVDRAVPALVQRAAAGQHVAAAILTCRRPGRDAGDYLKVTLGDVVISGVRLTDAAETQPSAEVTPTYGRITIEYRPQMPDGSPGPPVATGGDARANRRL